jgi:hypothetical protein
MSAKIITINENLFDGMSNDLLHDTCCAGCSAPMRGIKPVNGYHNPHRHLCHDCKKQDERAGI